MFYSARLKLTAWYLVIIMAVSISFTAFIYRGVSIEFENRLNAIEARLELRKYGFYPPPGQVEYFIQDLEEAKERVFYILVYTNLAILIFSAIAGFFLAGKTLHPIELAMNEQKRFVADASHEFKTPLTALQTSIEVALRDKKLSLREAKLLLKDSLSDIGNLSTLSNYLLGLAKFQRDNRLLKENVTGKEIVDNSVKKIIPLAKSKNILIEKDIVDSKFNGGKESLEKLMTILLENAIKYSPDKSKIVVKTDARKNKVIFEVKDQGMGIEKKDIPHIFERFYRADISRTKHSDQGFGLGLSLAEQIADQHKGEIKVSSEPGKGSVFKVILPL